MENPAGVAVDVEGNFIVAESENFRVQIFDVMGQSIRIFGSEGTLEGQLKSPWGVAVDREGNVVVADQGMFTSFLLILFKFLCCQRES